MNDEFQKYVDFRIQRSKSTLEDAKLLAKHGSWNSVVNRLYYACYYAISALLYTKGFEPKTHTGIKTIFFSERILASYILIFLTSDLKEITLTSLFSIKNW